MRIKTFVGPNVGAEVLRDGVDGAKLINFDEVK
jgi:hypothetical protein